MKKPVFFLDENSRCLLSFRSDSIEYYAKKIPEKLPIVRVIERTQDHKSVVFHGSELTKNNGMNVRYVDKDENVCFGKLISFFLLTIESFAGPRYLIIASLYRYVPTESLGETRTKTLKRQMDSLLDGKYRYVLLKLTSTVCYIPAEWIVSEVSLSHNCDNRCRLNLKKFRKDGKYFLKPTAIYHELSNTSYLKSYNA
jgi:hypothetical protein